MLLSKFVSLAIKNATDRFFSSNKNVFYPVANCEITYKVIKFLTGEKL